MITLGELLAVLGFGLGCFKVGYLMGKDSKKDIKNNRPTSNDAVIFNLTNSKD